MPDLTSVSRRELIQRLRRLGLTLPGEYKILFLRNYKWWMQVKIKG